MPNRTARTSQAVIVVMMLSGASSAVAQVQWCCTDASHAGATAAERCEENQQTFAKSEECAAHKAEHDRATGHDSTCSGAVERTRKGTASGVSRSIQ